MILLSIPALQKSGYLLEYAIYTIYESNHFRQYENPEEAGVPAKALSSDLEWKSCRMMDYNPKTLKYLITWNDSLKRSEWIPRYI
jgi:hypothetical protein